MAIQFRAIFPLALPGVLALVGWWWFFSRKKEHVSSRDRQAVAAAKDLRTDTPIEESLLREEVCYTRVVPLPSDGSRPPEKEIVTMGKNSVELVTKPSQAYPVPRKSDSTSTFPVTTDPKLQMGVRKEDGKLEKAASQQETRSITKEPSLPPLKDAVFPHEAIELQKQESLFSLTPGKGWPDHLEAPSEQHGPLEKIKETSGIEGTGDAAPGENMSEEGGLSHDLRFESRNRLPSQDTVMEEEKGKESRSRLVRTVQKEEYLGKVLNSFIASSQAELSQEEEALTHQVRGSRSGGFLDGDHLAGELKKGSPLEIREEKGSPLEIREEKGSLLEIRGEKGSPLEIRGGKGSLLEIRGEKGSPLEIRGEKGSPLEIRGEKGSPLEIRGEKGSPLEIRGEKGSPLEIRGEKGSPLEIRGEKGSPLEIRGEKGSPLESREEKGSPLEIRGEKGSPLEIREEKGSPLEIREEKGSPLEIREEKGSPLEIREEKGSPLEIREEKGSPLEIRGEKGSPLEIRGEKGSPLEIREEKGSPLEIREEKGSPLEIREEKGSPLEIGEEKGSPLEIREEKGSPLEIREEKGSPLEIREEKGSPLEIREEKGSLLEIREEKGSLEIREDIEQAAMQIISKVILAAKEEMLGKTVGSLKQHNCQPLVSWVEGSVEENFALASQKPVLGQNILDPSRAVIEPPKAVREIVELEAAGLQEEEEEEEEKKEEEEEEEVEEEEEEEEKEENLIHEQVSYVSCLTNSLMSRAALDDKPKNSAHRFSLAACPPQAVHHSESFEEANIRVEDTSCVTCMSEDSQRAQSVSSSGHSSDSAGTSGLEESSMEPNLSPSNNPLTSPLLERTVSYSNGVLKGESSDLGTEDRWTTETEADQSGGSDVNSMDSVDSGCGLRKTESHSSSQAGTESNKVELTIWEIEVPKHLVGRLIGKQGRYVSFLKQTSGAKIYISTLPYTQNFQICHIEGSQHHVDKALSLIGKKFKELNLTNIYAPPLPSLTLPSLPMTSWLMLPDGVTVEVIVVNQVNAGHMFVQQHTHPTFHALRSLDQQMYLCYSQPGIPTLPTPVEAVICAAPGLDGAWWRAQVVAYYKESDEVEIRYVDYGGYKRVKTEILRQIRSDFVTLPFQGAEVLLDNVAPLSDEDHFSPEADAAVSEMTRGTPLLAQVTNYNSTGLPLIQLWSMIGEEAVSINRTLVERGLAQWIDSYYTSL
ncbi:A-kinase anchor protein 1, mitochondrial isoform X2 [Monodelphis domestica]|uniref:A-kinase anchor protein 1, mitochondrial isoform X2 n=1 Tax=Monodelphis domestica TaxID=13616 RepID=UPI0024E253E1|nr:A-kinase anchor protein 1, mitochondrial isoform X2 [Monodelphis domestica]